ncbi:lycopene cyclase family protein [Lacinutrix undariae]
MGNGLAGLKLALRLSEDPFFKTKTIALIDSSDKKMNDKTWSFWEKGAGKWDHLLLQSWETALFKSHKVALNIPLKPYTYKNIRSLDFYSWAINTLKKNSNISFIIDTIKSVSESSTPLVSGYKNTYAASHVFDSRITSDYNSTKEKHTLIQQHFRGHVIETKQPCFKVDAFTIMDFEFQHENTTSFMYVLPYSEYHALIEFTFFSSETVANKIYNDAIKKYIKLNYKINDYSIIETECGNIPMTDYPFWKDNTNHITKIGTAGGWVKPSSGYAFKLTEKYVDKIIDNLKNNRLPSYNLYNKKFRFYDTIFLNVLKHNNEKGPWIFERYYSKNSIKNMFEFLDEDSNIFQDLAIIISLFSTTFIKALFRVLFRR